MKSTIRMDTKTATAADLIDDMEGRLHDLHGLAAVMVAAIRAQEMGPLDRGLVADGLLRLGTMISDMAGELKAKQAAAYAALSQREQKGRLSNVKLIAAE